MSFMLLILRYRVLCEDGLQGAFNVMERRQQDLMGYPKFEKFYSESGVSRYSVPENNLVFLGQADVRGPSPGNRERSQLEYLEDIDFNNRQSAFRERKLQENRIREQQELAEILLNHGKDSSEYADLLKLYQKYGQYEQPQPSDYYGDLYEKNELRKKNRHFSNNAGFNLVGMRKRNTPSYQPVGESGDPSMYLLNVPGMRSSQMYPNLMAKRFPVAKRSSNYYPIPFTDEMPRQFKRSSHLNKNEKLMQTDPKVEEDLSSIFSHNSNRKVDNKHGEEDKVVSKPKRTEHATETSKSSETTVKMATTQKPNLKLNISEHSNSGEKEKPIQIKKKSIDWSDYFGLDKRKKPDNNNLDNEWLMERYHKAVALNSKRNPENIDDDNNKSNKTKSSTTTDEKINDMDSKLKNIEYAIVDRALKASTASDETEFDTKEEQEMKDRIISQLATAYRLEKMRRALNEYRESIKKERLALKAGKSNDNRKAEEKRLSVPRKSAGDLEVVSADNNIKCVNTDENCVEQNYKTPEDLLDNINFGYCPKVQRACAEIASILGQYEKMLENACVLHQMCLLCGDNTWFPPTRQCNVLFLNKADYLCNDDIECKEVARHSTRYLLELNSSLRSEPLDSCDLAC
ncbi:hypothetical protein MML48_7g00020738 [Holotrichia oblita]|uniref:Uncharacterized protein n=1 Tax=Holotrichia oblita TaxID=644536 RepID=A0ACB9SVK7_HOLOL|nr:hypothetical protein MML48_7g00020738 [Holotrichia oblita]